MTMTNAEWRESLTNIVNRTYQKGFIKGQQATISKIIDMLVKENTELEKLLTKISEAANTTPSP